MTRRKAGIQFASRRAASSYGKVPGRHAFSIMESTIAIGILGVGLIMIAAIFPVALTQHRVSTERAAALELMGKAGALMESRYSAQQLWVDPQVLASGLDSPWYLLPTVNVMVGANNATSGANNWDAMPVGSFAYADVIDGINANNNSTTNATYATTYAGLPASNPLSPLSIYGIDLLSDRVAPYTTGNSYSPFMDEELMEAGFRFVWYGFYRRLSTGATQFAAAVCKQRKEQIFAEQDLTVASPAANPTMNTTNPRRLPVPWRVSVAYTGGNIITNAAAAPLLGGTMGLATIAPIGTKVFVTGAGYTDAGIPPLVRGGTVLTVSDVIDDFTVEVIGDRSGLPLWDPDDPPSPGPPNYTFDVWVFPPAVEGNTFGRASPLVDWNVGM